MSIAAEDEHETVGANVSRMAISGSRLDSLDNAEVGLLRTRGRVAGQARRVVSGVHVAAELSLLHHLVVGIEGLVSVLDDETLLHLDADRGGKAAFLLLLGLSVNLHGVLGSATGLGSQLGRGLVQASGRAAVLSGGGGLVAHLVLHRSLLGERRVVDLIGSLVRDLNSCQVIVVSLADCLESLLAKIVEQHLIELLRQLEDTSEDNHLTVVNVGRVTAAALWLVRVGTQSNLLELLGVQVEAPEVVQLHVVVAHAAENVALVVEDAG